MFRRDRGCCGDCGSACTTVHSAPVAEPLKDQPKRMPGKADPKKATETQAIYPPARTSAPGIQNAPAIAPNLAPRVIENDARNPF
jgi:hypothetical protein